MCSSDMLGRICCQLNSHSPSSASVVRSRLVIFDIGPSTHPKSPLSSVGHPRYYPYLWIMRGRGASPGHTGIAHITTHPHSPVQSGAVHRASIQGADLFDWPTSNEVRPMPRHQLCQHHRLRPSLKGDLYRVTTRSVTQRCDEHLQCHNIYERPRCESHNIGKHTTS